jgi:hypothetical protein
MCLFVRTKWVWKDFAIIGLKKHPKMAQKMAQCWVFLNFVHAKFWRKFFVGNCWHWHFIAPAYLDLGTMKNYLPTTPEALQMHKKSNVPLRLTKVESNVPLRLTKVAHIFPLGWMVDRKTGKKRNSIKPEKSQLTLWPRSTSISEDGSTNFPANRDLNWFQESILLISFDSNLRTILNCGKI